MTLIKPQKFLREGISVVEDVSQKRVQLLKLLVVLLCSSPSIWTPDHVIELPCDFNADEQFEALDDECNDLAKFVMKNAMTVEAYCDMLNEHNVKMVDDDAIGSSFLDILNASLPPFGKFANMTGLDWIIRQVPPGIARIACRVLSVPLDKAEEWAEKEAGLLLKLDLQEKAHRKEMDELRKQMTELIGQKRLRNDAEPETSETGPSEKKCKSTPTENIPHDRYIELKAATKLAREACDAYLVSSGLNLHDSASIQELFKVNPDVVYGNFTELPDAVPEAEKILTLYNEKWNTRFVHVRPCKTQTTKERGEYMGMHDVHRSRDPFFVRVYEPKSDNLPWLIDIKRKSTRWYTYVVNVTADGLAHTALPEQMTALASAVETELKDVQSHNLKKPIHLNELSSQVVWDVPSVIDYDGNPDV